MTRLKFNELVETLERRYASRSASLARATAGWLLFGYAVLFSGLALPLAGGLALMVCGWSMAEQSALWMIVGGAVVSLLAIGLYGPLIWTPRDPRKESDLSAAEAPALHALVAEIRQALDCRAFDRILLNAEVNAAVVTEPRFGLLGGTRRLLLLGLPLMELVSVAEFRAVLAHEFVHHSRAHGRFSVWVYRVRNSWERIYAELESGKRRRSLRWVQWFLRWYWPRMNARALLLCREHEYEADHCAAEYSSPTAAATGLHRIETMDRYLDLAFWPALQRESEKLPAPPANLLERLLACLAAPGAELGAWCAAATFARLTDTANTHPAWADRTSALGEDPMRYEGHGFPARPTPSAAEALLGDDRSRLSQRVSELWAKSVTATWGAQHRRLTGLRRRLNQIAPLVETRPSDISLRWEQACLVKELDGPDAAPPLLEHLCNLDPPHRAATFERGQLALAHGDARGAAILEEFVHEERDSFYEPACNVLCSFFCLTGRVDEMREMEARIDGRDAWADWIREGHRHLTHGVPCQRHGLSANELAPIVVALEEQGELAAAWLARVGKRHPGSPPLFILCVSTPSGIFGLGGRIAEQSCARRLVGKVMPPGRVLIIARRGPDRRLARRVRAVPSAQIYPIRVESPVSG